MYERARLTMRSTTSRDAATKPPSEPNVFDSVPTRTTIPPGSVVGGRREVGAENGVGLIEDEESVVAPAEVDELGEGGDVTVHGEDGVGDDDGRPGGGGGVRQQLLQVVHVAVAVDGEG